jgi:hypothetical protein
MVNLAFKPWGEGKFFHVVKGALEDLPLWHLGCRRFS